MTLRSPRRLVWVSLAAVAASVGCAAPPAAVRAAIDSASAGLFAAMRTNDVDSLLTRLADDAVLMPPNQAPLIGKAAVGAWYTGLLSQVHTVSVTVADREVFLGDGWAVERASFEWVVNPVGGGDPITDPGNFMQIWQRQPDGRWLLSREVWNSTSPAPQ